MEIESELLRIIKDDYKILSTNPLFTDYIDSLLDFYTKSRENTKQNLLSGFEYYNYSCRSNFINPKEYPHLSDIYPHIMLNKEPGQYEIEIFLDYDGGICTSEEKVKHIIKDPEIFYSEELEKLEEIYDIHTHILATWLTYLWQEIDGNEYGVVVKFDEHGLSYFFNDQCWDDDSKYQFEHKIKNYRTAYKNLSILEIYNKVRKK